MSKIQIGSNMNYIVQSAKAHNDPSIEGMPVFNTQIDKISRAPPHSMSGWDFLERSTDPKVERRRDTINAWEYPEANS